SSIKHYILNINFLRIGLNLSNLDAIPLNTLKLKWEILMNELEAVDLDRATIGLLCKKERTRLGKTQEELSDERISVSTISLIERGASHVSEDTVKYYVEKLRLTEQIYNTMSPTRQEEENTKKRLYDIESLISAIDPETALRRLNELEIQTYNKPYSEYIKGLCFFELGDLNKSKKHFQS